MNIIIPATGEGKRFKDVGYKNLKPFIKVNKKECILDFVVKCFDVKNDKFYFIVRNDDREKFSDFIKSRKLDAKILIYDGAKLGPGGALWGVKDKIMHIMNEPVIVSYCDFGQEWDYKHFLLFIENNHNAQGIIPCYTGYHPHLEADENVYAACKVFEKSNSVYQVIEKYYSSNKFDELYSSGIYFFKTLEIAFNALEKQIESQDMLKGEYYLSITNNYLEKVLCYPFVEKFYQFGTPKDFKYVKEKLKIKSNLVNMDAKIDNTVILSAGRGERFFNLNFLQPKPFLPLKNSTIIENIIKNLKNIKTNIICVGAKDHKKYWQQIENNVRYVEPNKKGAAYSYIKSCNDLEGDVLILPCDLLAKHITLNFKEIQSKTDAIIFTARANQFNYDNPHYFTWIKTNSNNEVEEVFVKERPNDSDMIMIGSFYFKDNQFLIAKIKEMFDKNLKINGEFFIDNVFNLMLGKQKIHSFLLDNYLSFGTPKEYLENNYWV